jgi:hypothetical protein
MSAFPDSKLLNDEQKRKLSHMLYMALLEMRSVGLAGKAQQAADLADAFHNLPTGMWLEEFSLDFFRKFLESYRQKYPEAFNYLPPLDEVIALGGRS